MNVLDCHSLMSLLEVKGFASFLHLKSSQNTPTIQWQEETSRCKVVTMATKIDLYCSIKIGHFVEKK